ncbi:DUF485 domain-containing protein [Streptomyces sp. AcE210]|uniref:DUF485 domain-containing protein n=1 Tax=Streptomyces sp. AcE210 TaxID=2292703 RepID=UPI000E308269|nr:DUF485 domain-containing protein [Streptomyces sp. AcE210]RFC70671.1 DUF485 domain-containing protein [Streptomyces sp. AcE210]
MTLPHHPWDNQHFTDTPAPHHDPGARSLLTALRRLRRRHTGRLLVPYALLATVMSVAPDALRRRIVGHVSVALLLLLLQLALIIWVLAGHRRSAAHVDRAVEKYRRELAAFGRREAP